MQITEALTRQIHAAMEAAGGSASQAAELLGMERRKLYDFIHNNADLKARWGTSKEEVTPPSEAVTLHRPALPLREEAEEIAKAVEAEDAAMRKGLASIGVRGGALDMAVALQEFHSKHFGRAIEMLGGGISKQFLDLMSEVERISNTLNDPTAVLEPEREMMLREDRSRLLDLMGKFFDKLNQAVVTQAKVRAIQNAKEGKGKPGKPGFSPLVAVHGNNVTINEK